MNDIDFDELDRAVSSAISSPGDTPSLAVPTRSAASPDRPAQSPAARRGGRFMDVVHPSSDMRNGASGSSKNISTSSDSDGAPESPALEQAWPDPIDLAEQSSSQNNEPSVESTSPLDSPFMPGAKVEKRPLGVPTPASSLDDALAQLNMSDEVVADEVAPTVEETETPDSEDIPVITETEAESLGEPASSDVSIDESAESKEPEVSDVPIAPSDPEPAAVTPSIPQQYTEHAPDHDAAQSGAIFDTESYHQPFAQPAKKHSSVLIVIWILGLVVLGGGLGAAAYFFLLPLL